MFEKMMVLAMFCIGIGITGVGFFRKKTGVVFCEKWIRILFSILLIPYSVFLYGLNVGLPIKGIFLISWLGFTVWVWKTPVLCPYCLEIVVRGLITPKHCPNCGKELHKS